MEITFSRLKSKQYCPSFSKDIITLTKAQMSSRGSLLSWALDTNQAQTLWVSDLNPFSLHPNTHTIIPFLTDYLVIEGVMVLLESHGLEIVIS